MTTGGAEMADVERRLAGLEASVAVVARLDTKMDDILKEIRSHSTEVAEVKLRQQTQGSDLRRAFDAIEKMAEKHGEVFGEMSHKMEAQALDNRREHERLGREIDTFKSDYSANLNQVKGGWRVLVWVGGVVQVAVIGAIAHAYSEATQMQAKLAKLEGLVEPIAKAVGKVAGN